ncbi:MAG: hypothetical protein RI925_1729 [Pseudomonadota bacterium]
MGLAAPHAPARQLERVFRAMPGSASVLTRAPVGQQAGYSPSEAAILAARVAEGKPDNRADKPPPGHAAHKKKPSASAEGFGIPREPG